MNDTLTKLKILAVEAEMPFIHIRADVNSWCSLAPRLDQQLRKEKEQDNPCIIVVSDEHGATPTLQQNLCSTLYERKWGGRDLNPKTRVFMHSSYNDDYLGEYDAQGECLLYFGLREIQSIEDMPNRFRSPNLRMR